MKKLKKDDSFNVKAWHGLKKSKEAREEEKRMKRRKAGLIMKYLAFVSAVVLLWLCMNPGTCPLHKAAISALVVTSGVLIYVFREEIIEILRSIREDFEEFKKGKNK